jgi:pimeloyl-ACP methyl ester carboxylesterase
VTTPILMVHAFPVDAGMWEPQLSAIAGRAIVAPNLPGFGGTESSEPVMTMRAGARACIDALNEADIDRAVVCGLSMGGYVAFELWRRYRDRVAGLVLANTRADADDEARVQARNDLAAKLVAEGNAFLAENPPPLLSENAPDVLWKQVRRSIARQPARSIAAAALGMAERQDSTPDLAGIDVPTLVITSDADTLIPAEATTPIADAVPGAVLATIEGAGHLSNLEGAGDFNRLLAAHARRCDQA